MTIVEHVCRVYDWSRQNQPQVQKPLGFTLKLMPFATILSPHDPRSTPHAPRQTSGVRSCADPPPLATACHRPPNCQRPNGTRSRRAAPLCQYVTEIQYVTEPGNFFGLIHPFLPARRRPTVDHSLAAGGAQRQGSGRGSGRGHPLSGTWETWMALNVTIARYVSLPVSL